MGSERYLFCGVSLWCFGWAEEPEMQHEERYVTLYLQHGFEA